MHKEDLFLPVGCNSPWGKLQKLQKEKKKNNLFCSEKGRYNTYIYFIEKGPSYQLGELKRRYILKEDEEKLWYFNF